MRISSFKDLDKKGVPFLTKRQSEQASAAASSPQLPQDRQLNDSAENPMDIASNPSPVPYAKESEGEDNPYEGQ